jgi:hypothetical protein
MKHHMTSRSREIAALLWSCVALFALRVIGQFEVLMFAPDWLPDMDAWYSGLLPYYLLLPAQVALLMVMAVAAWNRRIRTGRFAAGKPRVARVLRGLAFVYALIMGLRLAIDFAAHGADFWRAGAIPVAFHWVLALFLLVCARASNQSMGDVRPPSEDRHQYDEADDVPHGDVPSLSQPLTHGFGLGEQVRYSDAR